jgi:hypothetical protein
MTIQHVTLTSSNVHEPKHITNAGTADTGKVITPSGSSPGISELRRLRASEIDNERERLVAVIDDISTAGNTYLVAPFSGTITRVQLVIDGALTVADAEVTVNVGATTVATITVEFDGSAAGDVYTQSVSSSNSVNDNQAIRINTDGASDGTVKATVVLTFTRD